MVLSSSMRVSQSFARSRLLRRAGLSSWVMAPPLSIVRHEVIGSDLFRRDRFAALLQARRIRISFERESTRFARRNSLDPPDRVRPAADTLLEQPFELVVCHSTSRLVG